MPTRDHVGHTPAPRPVPGSNTGPTSLPTTDRVRPGRPYPVPTGFPSNDHHRPAPHRTTGRPPCPQLSNPSPARSSVRSHRPRFPVRSSAAMRFWVILMPIERSGSGGNGRGFSRT